jgi:hypothetical protein
MHVWEYPWSHFPSQLWSRNSSNLGLIEMPGLDAPCSFPRPNCGDENRKIFNHRQNALKKLVPIGYRVMNPLSGNLIQSFYEHYFAQLWFLRQYALQHLPKLVSQCYIVFASIFSQWFSKFQDSNWVATTHLIWTNVFKSSSVKFS